ncbi:hypothetical protein QFC22_006099 [Naganishia vaughanmartiniae]|uniref:Uncharacterized protein n=1 Tax=Naganishia vaughanmartiniae TaxID=1424756 RepID=A0ACC2WMR1_9TREE|nr:hypothetical protein QFC22_006099 [Naganishia vaughanmartiniae]
MAIILGFEVPMVADDAWNPDIPDRQMWDETSQWFEAVSQSDETVGTESFMNAVNSEKDDAAVLVCRTRRAINKLYHQRRGRRPNTSGSAGSAKSPLKKRRAAQVVDATSRKRGKGAESPRTAEQHTEFSDLTSGQHGFEDSPDLTVPTSVSSTLQVPTMNSHATEGSSPTGPLLSVIGQEEHFQRRPVVKLARLWFARNKKNWEEVEDTYSFPRVEVILAGMIKLQLKSEMEAKYNPRYDHAFFRLSQYFDAVFKLEDEPIAASEETRPGAPLPNRISRLLRDYESDRQWKIDAAEHINWTLEAKSILDPAGITEESRRDERTLTGFLASVAQSLSEGTTPSASNVFSI